MVYYLQVILSLRGIIAQAILVVLMMMSFYAFLQVNISYRTGSYLKWLNIMLLVITAYGLVLFFSGFALYPDELNLKTGWRESGYLQRYYMSVIPIYAFYLYSLQGQLSGKNMKSIFLAFLFFSILMYYQNYFLVSQEIDREEITNNMGYRLVPLIPMLALFKMKDVWKYAFLIIIIAFIMMSMKRGAILVGGVLTILYLIHNLHTKSKKRLLYLVILSSILLIITYQFVIQFYDSSDYFQSRINQTISGDSSGRDIIYKKYLDFFIHKTNSLEFLIGNGANGAWALLGDYAHNDWLEFAINQGIIGVMMYLVYWILFYREWKDYQGQTVCKQVLGDIGIAYFMMTFFSMSFDGMVPATTLCIGFCIAQNMRSKYKYSL